MKATTFGRRVRTQQPVQQAAAPVQDTVSPDSMEAGETPVQAIEPFFAGLSPEEELEQWKAERRRERLSRIPWRQLSLMAGLCFGLAGLVLPDSVNDAASWLLFGLMAAALYAGSARPRKSPSAF